MASINGLTLKAIERGIGHDRAGFRANLYLNNKRIGEVEDDGFGAGMDISYSPEHKAFIKETVEKYYKKFPSPFMDEQMFFWDLYHLCNLEKRFKKNVKEKYPVLLEINHRNVNKPTVLFDCFDVETAHGIIAQQNPTDSQMYTSLDDFNVAV